MITSELFNDGSDSRSQIQSIKKARNILLLFGEKKQCTLSEINEQLNMPVATLYRFLTTLVSCGFLDFTPRTKLYSLGSIMIYLGNTAANSLDIIELAKPIMHELKEATNETISLFTRSRYKKICIAKDESDMSVRYAAKIGVPSYLHAGASGYVLLTGMTLQELDKLEETVGFPKLTPYTRTDRREIEKTIQKTISDGYYLGIRERSEYSGGIGVPVKDYKGQVIASLNITFPAERYDPQKAPSWIKLLQDAGLRLSRKNGYIGN